jgi:hypothetical protein
MAVTKTTLHIGKKVLVLQDPDKLTVNHTVHSLADIFVRQVFSRFQNVYYTFVPPGRGECVLPYMVIYK